MIRFVYHIDDECETFLGLIKPPAANSPSANLKVSTPPSNESSIMLRMVVKRVFPESFLTTYRSAKRWASNHFVKPENVFTSMYHGLHWGDPESASGPGSTLMETEKLRETLPLLLRELGVKVMIDSPCGDMNWMPKVDLPVDRYIGIDLVPAMIESNTRKYANDQREFRVGNIISDDLPKADLIFCRDCLIHLSFKHVHASIANFQRSGSTYLLCTHNPLHESNTDIVTGSFRKLNMEKAPFDFPPPVRLIQDGGLEGKTPQNPDRVMGLWKLADLPSRRK